MPEIAGKLKVEFQSSARYGASTCVSAGCSLPNQLMCQRAGAVVMRSGRNLRL